MYKSSIMHYIASYCYAECSDFVHIIFTTAGRVATTKGAPKISDFKRMEDMIARGAVMEFYQDSGLQEFYLDILHDFVMHSTQDKKVAEEELSHPVDKKSIFDIVTSRNEAFVFLSLANNVEGWHKRLQETGNRKKKCVGRWTKISKDPEDAKKHGRLTNCSGWSGEGLAFYESCKVFFAQLRDHPNFTNYEADSIQYYYREYQAPRLLDAKNKSRKRARAMAARAHEDAPDYGEMDEW
jgi:hypothetical protein